VKLLSDKSSSLLRHIIKAVESYVVQALVSFINEKMQQNALQNAYDCFTTQSSQIGQKSNLFSNVLLKIRRLW
jgi:hypothetical protein